MPDLCCSCLLASLASCLSSVPGVSCVSDGLHACVVGVLASSSLVLCPKSGATHGIASVWPLGKAYFAPVCLVMMGSDGVHGVGGVHIVLVSPVGWNLHGVAQPWESNACFTPSPLVLVASLPWASWLRAERLSRNQLGAQASRLIGVGS